MGELPETRSKARQDHAPGGEHHSPAPCFVGKQVVDDRAQPPGQDGQRDQELLEDALQEGKAVQEHRAREGAVPQAAPRDAEPAAAAAAPAYRQQANKNEDNKHDDATRSAVVDNACAATTTAVADQYGHHHAADGPDHARHHNGLHVPHAMRLPPPRRRASGRRRRQLLRLHQRGVRVQRGGRGHVGQPVEPRRRRRRWRGMHAAVVDSYIVIGPASLACEIPRTTCMTWTEVGEGRDDR